MNDADKLPVDLNKVFIAIGCLGAVAIGWLAQGQPGIPLKDGDYSCARPGSWPGAIRDEPAVTVVGGRVVDAWDFNMSTGERNSVPWSDAERRGPKELSVTSVSTMSHSETAVSFVCSYSSPSDS